MGLRLRMVLVLALPAMVLVGAHGFLRVRQEQGRLMEERERNVALAAAAAQIAVEHALRDGKVADIQQLVTAMSSHQDVIDQISVFDRNLSPISVSNPLAIGEDLPADALRRVMQTGVPEALWRQRGGVSYLSYIAPLRGPAAASVGSLQIVSLSTGVEQRVREATWDVLTRLGLLLAAIIGVTTVAVQRQVLRPLARLTESIRKLGRGEPGPPLPVQRADELGEVAGAFNSMAQQLETARQRLVAESERVLELERELRNTAALAVAGKLSTSLAHEIGTPLNIISGRAEFLAKTLAGDDAARNDLEAIVTQIDRITDVISSLLDSVRPHKPEVRPTPMDAVIDRALPLMRFSARRSGVVLTTSVPPNLPMVLCDAGQVQQVLINLVVNAIDATAAGGRVTVHAERHDHEGRAGVALLVSDTGAGIAAEHLPKVFAPFFTTKPPGQGTGLGLAICRDIVRAHGGDIHVESQVGVGTTFTVWFPAPEGART